MKPDPTSMPDALAPGPSDRSPGSASGFEPLSGRERAQDAALYGWRYTFRSLANRDFRFMWLGTLFIMSGFQMGIIAQSYWVYQETGSAKILAFVSAASALPVIGLALVGGAIADRVERKRLLQVCQTASTLLALYIAVAITTGTLRWQHLVVVALLQGAIWSFNGPARQALIPQLVGRERAGNAIALVSAGMSLGSLLSPAIAGVIYAVVGADGVYYTVAGLGVLAVAATTSIRPNARVVSKVKTRVAADIITGVRLLWSSHVVRMLLAIGLAFMLLSWPLQFLLPMFVVEVYHRESEALGLLVSTMGLGGLTGTLFIASLRESKRGLILLGAGLLSGLGLVLVASIPAYYPVVAIMVIVGLGNSGVWSLVQVLIMGQVEDEYRGRVMSVFMMNFGLMPLALLPAGIFADMWGPQKVVGATGAALLVIAVLIAITQRELRQLQ